MDLSLPLNKIKGIGPKTAELLAAAGLDTFHDLLYYLPRTYENYQGASAIADLKPGKVILKATVEGAKTQRKRRNLSLTEATLRDSTGATRAVWFNQPYRAKQFESGKEYYFSGTYGFSYGRYQLENPSATIASDYDATSDKFQPIYPAKGDLTSKKLIQLFAKQKASFRTIPDLIPGHPGRAEALFKIHFPESEEEVKEARAYLAHEELFELILASALNRQKNAKLSAPTLPLDLAKLKTAIASLPFKLTNAQRRALWEIVQDLEKPIPMNRLLQGDVGSGKTIVAGLAALMAAAAGHQTALLAPTEILAIQHAESLHKLLSPLGVTVAQLTGSTKNKKSLKTRIASGEVNLVVGTHALLTDDTKFHSLALAIIDEQHRFGVRQRQTLLQKSGDLAPHLLSMTATPIPRSLQLTIFGDLAVSILNELPRNRQPITTRIISPNSTAQMWQAVNGELSHGHQAFYICKTIEDTGTSELSNVKKETEKLHAVFPNRRIEYLHGKMKPAEKDQLMTSFAAGNIDILVSTTVVEVGIDVPNATAIVIADADRYGLAQLHQLRGRVGRGTAPSYCYLISSTSDKPTRRMREIENSTDGFYLAEVDLKLRGPGAIYGTLQHGILDLRIATITDTKAIEKAQRSVASFLQTNPNMLDYKELNSDIKRYQKITLLN